MSVSHPSGSRHASLLFLCHSNTSCSCSLAAAIGCFEEQEKRVCEKGRKDRRGSERDFGREGEEKREDERREESLMRYLGENKLFFY